MRRALFHGLWLALLCGAWAGAADAPKPDEARLQGTWIGREVERPLARPNQVTFTIRRAQAEFKESSPPNSYKGHITLHPAASPKQLDFAIVESTNPKFVGKTSLAIYKLDDDGTLTLAANEPGLGSRPQEFKRTETARLFVFKKALIPVPGPKALVPEH